MKAALFTASNAFWEFFVKYLEKRPHSKPIYHYDAPPLGGALLLRKSRFIELSLEVHSDECIVHSFGIFLRKMIEIVAVGHTLTMDYAL